MNLSRPEPGRDAGAVTRPAEGGSGRDAVAAVVRPEIRDAFEAMVALRRDLHRHPELGFREQRTAALVAERLASAGLEVRTGIAGTGVRGVIRTGSRRALCLRADMDALPIQEESEADYASSHPGVMHACGHDGHTTILLETARRLQAQKARLGGDITMVFQPAEEGPGGAKPMIEAGVLEDPRAEAAFGLHLWTGLPTGTVAVPRGPWMAAADEFELRIRGKGGHGALPHGTVDAVVVGSHVVTALQTLVSRNADPMKTAVVSIGTFHAGSNFNIVAETARLRGTLRTFDDGLRDLLVRRLEEVAEGTARALGASCEFEFLPHYPATVNDPTMSDFVADVAAEVLGKDRVIRDYSMMTSEDMSYFLRAVPGAYFLLGGANEARGLVHPHHSPRFDFDEEALAIGAEILTRIGESYFQRFPARSS